VGRDCQFPWSLGGTLSRFPLSHVELDCDYRTGDSMSCSNQGLAREVKGYSSDGAHDRQYFLGPPFLKDGLCGRRSYHELVLFSMRL
jgi:hypothetical protein